MTSPQRCGSSKACPLRFPPQIARVQLLTFVGLGIKAKVENKGQYDEYLRELKDIREELGVQLKEDMYPDAQS